MLTRLLLTVLVQHQNEKNVNQPTRASDLNILFLSERASDWLAFAHFGAEQGERGDLAEGKITESTCRRKFSMPSVEPFHPQQQSPSQQP